MSITVEPAGQPPAAYPFRITYERRWLSPDAEWAAIFRSGDHPCGYSVNLSPAANSVVLGRHPQWDSGVVHIRLELHDGLESAWAAGEVARRYFAALGYPDTVIRIQGVEIEAAATPGDKPQIAAVAMLAIVRCLEQKTPHGAMLPWMARRDCRGPGRHTVVGLVHELYALLAEVCENFHMDEQQLRLWTYQGPGGFARGQVQVSRQRPGRLHVSADRLHLGDELARTRFAEFIAALRCHPAVWGLGISTDAEAGEVERVVLIEAGFEDQDSGADEGEEIKQWWLNLRS